MLIKSIKIKNFRNYEEEEVVFHPKLNIITGKNAQGKTNLIEAINLLSLAKSFRTKKENEMIMKGKDFYSVKGEFEKNNKDYCVEIIQNIDHSIKKKYLINGAEKSKVFDIIGGVYTIVFSPEDLEIVKGNPEKRRTFLDREIILLRPIYYKKLRKYKKIIMQRNALLKQENVDNTLLDIYDEALAEAGAEIIAERLGYLSILSEAGKENEKKITDEEEELKIIYDSNINIEEEKDKDKIKNYIQEELIKTRDRDLKIGTTEKGPHRDDFKIFVNDKELKIFGSQGQKRTAALALKLAEEKLIRNEISEQSIILLDDVMSELDTERQKNIIEGFEGNQIFITGADISKNVITKLSEGKIINIDDGKIESVAEL